MKKLLFVLAGLAFALTAAAQELRITHGPYLCDMSQDRVTVVWTTSRPALSWVEASPADSLAPAPPQPRYYQTVAGRKLAGRTLHAVRVRGLQPGTGYRYRIFSQEVQSWPDVNNVTYGKTVDADAARRRAYGFRTFPAAGSACSFLVLNDIHGKADYLTRLCKHVDFSELGFVAFNGDMSSSVESGEQLFKAYLDASAALFAAETPDPVHSRQPRDARCLRRQPRGLFPRAGRAVLRHLSLRRRLHPAARLRRGQARRPCGVQRAGRLRRLPHRGVRMVEKRPCARRSSSRPRRASSCSTSRLRPGPGTGAST